MTSAVQFARLPKHAQQTIEELRRKLTEAEIRITDLEAELSGGWTDSRVHYRQGMDDPRPLPRGAYIDFRLHKDQALLRRGWSLRALVREEGDDVYLDLNGDSTITVSPMASNAIQIRLKDRFS